MLPSDLGGYLTLFADDSRTSQSMNDLEGGWDEAALARKDLLRKGDGRPTVLAWTIATRLWNLALFATIPILKKSDTCSSKTAQRPRQGQPEREESG